MVGEIIALGEPSHGSFSPHRTYNRLAVDVTTQISAFVGGVPDPTILDMLSPVGKWSLVSFL